MSKRTPVLVPDEPRSSNDERRAAARYACHGQVSCFADGEIWTGRIRDVSPLGIGLLLPRAMEVGMILDIGLEGAGEEPVRTLRSRVVHVEEESGGAWLVGCAFVSELDDADLQVFQAYRIKPASPDFRRWVRFPCNVETVCYTNETAPGERHSARILNISAGGVGLLLPCQFSAGTLLQLELPSEAARLALIRIVRTLEHPSGSWFHGCEFVDQLAAGELQELVG